ncbi:MAG TPA: phosphoenolpyruvate-utilizing N-terminal domain-containing protein, partial [Chlamydiales bacterium]|nr:phosphoenolpyruvate-utilizing N-terminal domain-containing protein [Chlamydiales bacterium]
MDETLNGLSISQGIALGLAFHFIIPDELIPEQIISSQEIEQEIERYRKALEKSRKELEDLQKLVL